MWKLYSVRAGPDVLYIRSALETWKRVYIFAFAAKRSLLMLLHSTRSFLSFTHIFGKQLRAQARRFPLILSSSFTGWTMRIQSTYCPFVSSLVRALCTPHYTHTHTAHVRISSASPSKSTLKRKIWPRMTVGDNLKLDCSLNSISYAATNKKRKTNHYSSDVIGV